MEPRRSLLHSQVPATCPYLEPGRSSLYPHIQLPEDPSYNFPSTPGSPKCSLSLMFSTQTLFTPLLSPIRATCPAYLILLDFITRTILSEECRSLNPSLFSFLHSLITSFLLGQNILHNTLFSNTISLNSSLNVNDQVSHPYKSTGKIVVMHSLTFIFLNNKL